MTAYCIVVYNHKEETATVSQEAYRSYEQAEMFVKSRSDNPIEKKLYSSGCGRTGVFIGRDNKYVIKEIRVV